ncbi:THO complex subunit 4D-like isoform X2 [Hibiscus syriacus]|nr:THO complex subunit 4D-like isoform X2 [Hibiscus syriacus]
MVNRNNTGRGRARLRPPRTGRPSAGRMPLSTRRGPLGLNSRPSQHSITKPSHKTRSLPWQHELFEDSLRAAGISGVEVGTKLYVSNLDPGVTNEDIKELFSEIGELKRYSVHYDKNGRSSGSAEVVYLRRSDAFAALKRYNNVLLDGKPMIIEIVGANAEVPVSARVNVTGIKGRKKRTVVMTPGAGQSRSSTGINRGPNPIRRGGMAMRNVRGGGGRGRGRGRGHGKRNPAEKSADDLDKELENYHAEATNVS